MQPGSDPASVDEHLTAGCGLAAVIGNVVRDDRDTTGKALGSRRSLRICGRQLRTAHSQERTCERDRKDRRPQNERERHARDGHRNGEHAQRRLGWHEHNGRRQRETPRGREDERGETCHKVRKRRAITYSASLIPRISTSSRVFWNPPKFVR